MPQKQTEVIIVRHPQTVANAEGRFVGSSESEITDHGREQIMTLTAMMDDLRPSAVFTSPLKRALVTAQAIVACGIPVTVLDDLKEIDFGRAEGLTYAEITALGMKIDYLINGTAGAKSASDLDGPGEGPVAPGGETWTAFQTRVIRAAQTIENAGSRVAVVTHGGVFRTLLAHWMGVPMEASWRFSLPNATVATLRIVDGAGVLTSLRPGE